MGNHCILSRYYHTVSPLHRQSEFDVKELSDLLSRIIEISKEMVKVANRAAEACPNRLPKQVQCI